jgi:glycosyltransferase involved in cell wall biosynthesis
MTELTELGPGMRGVLAALVPGVTPASGAAAGRRQLAEAHPRLDAPAAWLVHAVLGPGLPTAHEVETLMRASRHQGTDAAVRALMRRGGRGPVRVVTDAVLVDVGDTAGSSLMTGVQRVAREVAERWSEKAGVQLVVWSTSRRRLLPIEASRFRSRRSGGAGVPIVPWNSRYVLPESVNEPARSLRIHALAAYSGSASAMIGHDAIPLTTAETTGPGMPGVFAKYLAAAARMQTVAATSTASATEFTGWRRMLGAVGLPGPAIATVPLPVTPLVPQPAGENAARALFSPDDIPLVLCVGSHEPRKNHLAVLHAAELRWRAGDTFRLVFVGSAGWAGDGALAAIEAARAAGRPVAALSGVDDGLLAWGYRLARLTVFPSLNEGFGLPVAESLAAGTPVVTSDFGSMAELGEGKGGLLVDPFDEPALAAAIGTLLNDNTEHARLRAQATAGPTRDWDDYARELWELIVE